MAAMQTFKVRLKKNKEGRFGFSFSAKTDHTVSSYFIDHSNIFDEYYILYCVSYYILYCAIYYI